ncbi:MAG: DEAD/DEAH box helicase family protein, partial [Opitutus sp.]
KKEGTTLSTVAAQSGHYGENLPDFLAALLPENTRKLPFAYESTGVETLFRDERDPDPRSRRVFAFHKPETLAAWLAEPDTLRARLRHLPALATAGMRVCQIEAITSLEQSFSADRPRALIQMATGAGKTYTACAFTYRLIRHAGARRVLFLVDRANLGRQAKGEFDQFVTPDTGRKFTELYNVQHLTSNSLDHVARVTICTIQRLYSILRGEAEFDEDLDEKSAAELSAALESGSGVPPLGSSPIDSSPVGSSPLGSTPISKRRDGASTFRPLEVAYNSAVPIEAFDFIITDECHRSIYGLWRQVLEYFDAHLIGLTATPGKQTVGFFNQNLVMEYNHERAVADGVNVGYEVYRIKTEVTNKGGLIEKGFYVDRRSKETRARRLELLDEDLPFAGSDLDRSIVVPSQIRTVLTAFRDALFTDLFPGRTLVPKTLIFAKDDSHAEDVVHLVREVFGRGNDFARKITYKSGEWKRRPGALSEGSGGLPDPSGAVPDPIAASPEPSGETPLPRRQSGDQLIAEFRTSPSLRIAVTVDMIATGTDIKPLECLLFLRDVRSRVYFEQMKGRGTRVLTPTDLQAVSGADARAKTHFVIVDAVGVCESDKTESRPLERQPAVNFPQLLLGVALGKRDEDTLTTLAGRLARLDRQLNHRDTEALRNLAGGKSLGELARDLLNVFDPDKVEAVSRRLFLQYLAEPSAHDEYGRPPIGYFDPNATVADLTGNLPHWRQEGVTYFVTFRLADSLPQEKLQQWREEMAAWLREHPEPHDEATRTEFYERFPARLQRWLDAGYGSCVLQIPEVHSLVEQAIRHFEGQRYALDEFVVAPNHVHALVTPAAGHELSDILHSWKSYTAHEILKVEAASRRLLSPGPEVYPEREVPKVEAASRRLSEADSPSHRIAKVEAASRRLSPPIHVWQKES